jgi:hypothetical protein
MGVVTVLRKGREMKRHAAVICLCAAVTGAASQPVRARSTSSASEAAKVRAIVVQEVRLYNQKRWQAQWRLFTPRVRSHCSYRRFLVLTRSIRNAYGVMSLRRVTVRVIGRRGFAAYSVVLNGRLIPAATAKNPDVFTRIGGRWSDDFDADGLCPSGDRPR